MRTLSGQRKWEKSVPITVYLVSTMRSIAYHARHPSTEVEALEVDTRGSESKQHGSPAHRGLQVSEGLIRPDPANTGARDDFSELLKSLMTTGDERAVMILEYLGHGYDAKEIIADLGITQTDHETTLKKIRRLGERQGLRSGRRRRGGA